MWSAPNYFGKFFNLASILEVDENLNKHFNVFEDSDRKVSDEEKKKQLQNFYSTGVDKYFQ